MTSLTADAFARRAKKLRWLLFDVDGVLTDGHIWMTAEGEQLKPFHAKDGLALKLARRVGLGVGLLSGRRSAPLERRAADLGLDEVMLGAGDKTPVFEAFLARHQIEPEHVAYIGDDLPDLPVLHRCALSFAPADAAAEVRAAAQTVLEAPAGQGAAREMIERILGARGEWAGIVASYASEP